MRRFGHGTGAVYNQTLSEKPWAPPGVSLIAARKMWPVTKGEQVVVAVLDTGIDYTHPDLAGNVIDGKSMIAGEKDYLDENGHGTHVAGTIAANGKLLGVAPHAKLLAVKVLDKDGAGSYASISQGIAWARKWQGPKGEKVNVINMSLGGPVPDNSMHKEIVQAVQDGISVVCAAGNSGDGDPNTPELSFPAYYEESLAVGAVDLQMGLANFSNSNEHIDIVAPGVATYSTYPDNRYVELSGTSMAAPHISGALALIYSRFFKRFGMYPTPEQIKNLLHYQAIDLEIEGFDNLSGYGLFSFNIDGGKSIQLFLNQKTYQVNTQEKILTSAPFVNNDIPCGSVCEISEILATDALYVPAGQHQQGKILIWS
ncbi:MAG TPA: S8 family peptidase [Syntrophomonadaceae bacterium]|nr:S8 family peptidase [Syntrophomonadaceae bacterium]HRX21294.1 S8 family peptidase [Syntrophomonadaceae bacterium]